MLLPSLIFDDKQQHFVHKGNEQVDEMVSSMHLPLSLTFQLTRGCNLRCIYCSEPPGIRTRKYEEMIAMLDKLSGMRRIILSGGEPMLYKRFWAILEYARGKFEKVVLSTNGVYITRENVMRLKELVDYIDITIDGPRRQHNGIRGNYDAVLKGVVHVASAGVPFSIICVYLPGNKDAIHYICQTGDALGAIKVKILTPIPKGRSINIFADFVTGDDIAKLKAYLAEEKQRNDWKIRITITDWMKVGEGHAILIEPDGRLIASPVWTHEDCVLPVGNLHQSSAEELWKAYPYKGNHLKKYLEHTLDVT
ncbi:MAG: putative mycofactocin radical SAM maturase MftC [Firmicutes bacterium]|nr:putative mycofactocin radical SAM maturase MftC [Bacillota bacterium]